MRTPTVAYLSEVARAAEEAGFASVLTPVGAGCLDPLVMCTAIAQHTTTLRMLVAFRAGFTLPTLLAQQAEAFQWISGGRLALNIVTGGDPQEQRAYGDFVEHDGRYAAHRRVSEVFASTWKASGSTSTAATTTSSAAASAPPPTPRRSTSAGRHRPPRTWRPGMPTST